MSSMAAVSSTPHFMTSVGVSAPATRTERKIRSFLAISYGWHYGSGRPALISTVRKALSILWNYIDLGFTETGAFPGVNGEIMVTAYSGQHCVELTIENDNTFTISHRETGLSRFFEGDLTHAQAMEALRDIAQAILGSGETPECDTSALFISDTMINGRVGLKTSPLQDQATEQAHPLFSKNAAWNAVEQSARILGNTTLE